MLIQYSLLLLGFFVGCHSHEICNFEHHLCKWSHVYSCHFVLETGKSLLGESGYLYLSKNTCKQAAIEFPVEKNVHRFQLHYFINGTGDGTLAIYADYFFSGRYFLWSCRLNQGPRWNKADIFVYDDSFVDSISYIGIEAIISGDMTIAIGNISPVYSGNPLNRCPKPYKLSSRKPTTTKPTHKPQTTGTTKILQTTSSITTISPKAETYHSTVVSTKTASKSLNTTLSQATNPTKPATSKPPASSTPKIKPTEGSFSTNNVTTSSGQTSKQIDQQDTTTGKVTTRYQRNSTASYSPQQSTSFQDVNTLKTVSEETNTVEPETSERLQSSKSKSTSVIIGGSVFAGIVVIVLAVVAFLIYMRRKQVWNVHRSNGNITGFSNPVFK